MERLKSLVFPLLIGIAGYYALFGGEYSWWELRQLRARQADEAIELELLTREIDSLKTWADQLENDSATLERIAREEHGLVAEGEVLYRLVDPEDSTEARDSGR